MLLTATPFAIALTPHLAHAFPTGDVFVSVASGQVKEFTPTGTLVRTLDTGLGGFTTGSAFDSAGNFYVTGFSASAVSKFDPTGTLIGTFGSGYATPEAMLFDGVGNVYVGNLGGFILKFDPAGTLLSKFNNGRTDWMDLSADQCTMLFDQEGNTIHRYNVCTNTALTDFSTTAGVFAMRILSSGSVLVADNSQIARLDSSGNVVQTYNASGESSWFALNLDPDGTTFWSADFGSSNVYRFDIDTGAQITKFNTGTGGSTVFGLSVNGEITVAQPKPPSCSFTNTVAGPPKQLIITVQDSTAGLDTISVTDSTNATVSVDSSFTAGDKGAVIVTATKVDQTAGAHVALHLVGHDGLTKDCDPVVPGEEPVISNLSAGAAAGGCNVGPAPGAAGLSGLIGGLVGLALFRRRRAASSDELVRRGGTR